MSRVEDNREFIASVARVQEENLDKNLDTVYRPLLLTTLLDISASLAVIADKLECNDRMTNGYCEDGIELLTDTEQRIFLKAMQRERAVCRTVDDTCIEYDNDSNVSLVEVCNSIERKVKKIWE